MIDYKIICISTVFEKLFFLFPVRGKCGFRVLCVSFGILFATEKVINVQKPCTWFIRETFAGLGRTKSSISVVKLGLLWIIAIVWVNTLNTSYGCHDYDINMDIWRKFSSDWKKQKNDQWQGNTQNVTRHIEHGYRQKMLPFELEEQCNWVLLYVLHYAHEIGLVFD